MTERRFTRKQALVAGGVGAAAVGGGAAAVVIATRDDDEGGDYPRLASPRSATCSRTSRSASSIRSRASRACCSTSATRFPAGSATTTRSSPTACSASTWAARVRSAPKAAHSCPCHQTKYDPAREGYVIQGVAQAPMPRIELEIDGDDIVAVGVNGLIYGYRENLPRREGA